MLSARLPSTFDDIPFAEQDSAILARFRNTSEPDATKLRRAEIDERIKLEKEKVIEYKLQIAHHRKQLLLIEKEEMRMDNKLETIIQGIWSRERKLINNFQTLYLCERRMQQKNDERKRRVERLQRWTREQCKGSGSEFSQTQERE